jgi:hypothetical protein
LSGPKHVMAAGPGLGIGRESRTTALGGQMRGIACCHDARWRVILSHPSCPVLLDVSSLFDDKSFVFDDDDKVKGATTKASRTDFRQ